MGKRVNLSNLKKTCYYLRRNGLKQAFYAAAERMSERGDKEYRYEPLTDTERKAQEAAVCGRKFHGEEPVTFSIVVPVYETPEAYLRALLDSLLGQTYPYWELILADGGRSERIKEIVEERKEARIHYLALEKNGGISENTNAAIKEASGDYIGLLDHDDFLTEDALFSMAEAIREGNRAGRDYGFIYSDEDKCDEAGKTFLEPHIKQKFNLDLFLSNNYICHFLVMKRQLLQSLMLRQEYDGAQDYDLCLRAVARLWDRNAKVEENIGYVPRVLYHWRCHQASTAANPRSKQYAYEAGKRALEDFIRNRGWQATVEHTPHLGFYRIIYEGGIFAQRADIAACAGKEIFHGKIRGNCYDEQGNVLYDGLPAHYGGYMHRALLQQDAAALDREHWVVNPVYAKMIETLTAKIASNIKTEQESGQQMDLLVCAAIRNRGLRLYWEPNPEGKKNR